MTLKLVMTTAVLRMFLVKGYLKKLGILTNGGSENNSRNDSLRIWKHFWHGFAVWLRIQEIEQEKPSPEIEPGQPSQSTLRLPSSAHVTSTPLQYVSFEIYLRYSIWCIVLTNLCTVKFLLAALSVAPYICNLCALHKQLHWVHFAVVWKYCFAY